jgi:putative transposase
MDWHTRKGLAFRRSNTLATDFGVAALKDARARCGRPERCNTEQAAQFTSATFTGDLKAHAITIRMDGKGRWVDHVCVARRWRTVKYEDIYLKAYETPRDRQRGLADYFRCYHTRRRHAALDRRTPDAAYFGELGMPKAA